MKRFSKFLRLTLGDFFCAAVLPFIGTGLCIAAVYALAAALGWVASRFGMDPIPDRDGSASYSMTGFFVGMAATAIGLVCYGVCNLVGWLRRKWREAGQP